MNNARIALEKIRKEIASYAFSSVPTVTASIGATQMQRDSSVSDIIAEADHCLYLAKQRGRDCVNVSEAYGCKLS